MTHLNCYRIPWLIDLNKINEYEISSEAKLAEKNYILEGYIDTLSSDERRTFYNETNDKIQDYLKVRLRELLQSGIVKIDINNFEVTSTALVHGVPLNQFSMDEYKGNLRIATTVGNERWRPLREIQENDVYIFDSSMNQIGSVTGMGVSEQIYAVRFIEDKGYVVTFRRIDPFYVLDLSQPDNPQLKGELKIPGFSSYLHPLNKDKILGVGIENDQIKLSLFNVQDPEKPAEASKFILEGEYSWAAVSNHHSYLIDKEKQLFFVPGTQGGYVFSYAGDELKLVKKIEAFSPERAIYIDDYFYMLSEIGIKVFDQSNWQEIASLDYQ